MVRGRKDGGRSAGLNSGLAKRLPRSATFWAMCRLCRISAWLAITASVVGSTRRMLCSSRTLYSLAS
jgi:hypothetical protein